MDAEYSSQPDLNKAAEYLTRSLEIRPTTYYRWIELGNVQLKRGLRDDALLAYERAKAYAPVGDEIVGPLTDQIRRVSRDDLSSARPYCATLKLSKSNYDDSCLLTALLRSLRQL